MSAANSALMHGWLRRLAQSQPHKDRFVLRGSLLTSVWCPRGNVEDVDHLLLTDTFDEPKWRADVDAILALPDPDPDADTVLNVATTTYERIFGDTPLPGLRTNVLGMCGSSSATLRIDIGFGDPLALPPRPITIGSATVLSVAPEIMYAWKTHGLFEFGQGQWRAKDLFDLVLLDSHVALETDALVRSLKIAFESRKSDVALADRFLYGVGWGESRGSRRKWETFARRYEHGEIPSLTEAIARVRARLLPLFAAL